MKKIGMVCAFILNATFCMLSMQDSSLLHKCSGISVREKLCSKCIVDETARIQNISKNCSRCHSELIHTQDTFATRIVCSNKACGLLVSSSMKKYRIAGTCATCGKESLCEIGTAHGIDKGCINCGFSMRR